MKFNSPEPKEVHCHIRVDQRLAKQIKKYHIHISESCRQGLRLAIEKAKKKAKS